MLIRQGDFLDVAPELSVATVVTLDRVICGHSLYERLLKASLKHAERRLALCYPRDVWYVRLEEQILSSFPRRFAA